MTACICSLNCPGSYSVCLETNSSHRPIDFNKARVNRARGDTSCGPLASTYSTNTLGTSQPCSTCMTFPRPLLQQPLIPYPGNIVNSSHTGYDHQFAHYDGVTQNRDGPPRSPSAGVPSHYAHGHRIMRSLPERGACDRSSEGLPSPDAMRRVLH